MESQKSQGFASRQSQTLPAKACYTCLHTCWPYSGGLCMHACQQKPGFLSSWRGEAGILKIRSMSSSRPVTAAGQLRGGGPATHKGDTQATAGSTLSPPLIHEAGPAADCSHIFKGKLLCKPWWPLPFSAISTGSFTGLHHTRDITQDSINGSSENVRRSFKSLNFTY